MHDKDCSYTGVLKKMIAHAVQNDEEPHLAAHLADSIGILLMVVSEDDFDEFYQELCKVIYKTCLKGKRAMKAMRDAEEAGEFSSSKAAHGNEVENQKARAIIANSEIPDDDEYTQEVKDKAMAFLQDVIQKNRY